MTALHKRFERNTAGRDLIIGDIHGCFTKARAALDAAGFAPARDRVFSVGDLVDRGPESEQVLDWLAQPWFHAVRGNHEDICMHLGDVSMHVANGGGWFVGLTPPERIQFVDAFEALPLAITLETEAGAIGIVHATCPCEDWALFVSVLEHKSDRPGFQHIADWAMWDRSRFSAHREDQVTGVRAVVVGHVPVERFTSLGNTFYIDSGGWLPDERARSFTVLDAATLAPAWAPKLDWSGA